MVEGRFPQVAHTSLSPPAEWAPVDKATVALIEFTLQTMLPTSILEQVCSFWGVEGIKTMRLLSKKWDMFTREKIPVVLRCRSAEDVELIESKVLRFSVIRGIVAKCVLLESSASICRGIQATGGTLEQLDLQWNSLTKEHLVHVLDTLGYARMLKFLRLNRNDMQMGTYALADALPNLPKLTELWMSNNNITSTHLKCLVPKLASVSQLSVLNLSSNPLGDEGAACVAEVLPSLTTLRVLDLSNCKITDKGALQICTALKDAGIPLDSLRLDVNQVSQGYPLAKCFSGWQVAALDLRGNRLDLGDAKAIWHEQRRGGGTATITYVSSAKTSRHPYVTSRMQELYLGPDDDGDDDYDAAGAAAPAVVWKQ